MQILCSARIADMIRVYYPEAIEVGQPVILGLSASHHLLNVLRLSIGDEIHVFNAIDPGQYSGEIIHAQRKYATFLPKFFEKKETESSLSICIAQGISRKERMDYMIQKSAELGAKEIVPLFTEHCVIKHQAKQLANRIDRWQQIAIAASEQSGRWGITYVRPAMSLEEWLAHPHAGPCYVCSLHYASTKEEQWRPASYRQANILIGPEGGLSKAEEALAIQKKFIPLSLGPRILRTETASIVAATLLQHHYGDIK